MSKLPGIVAGVDLGHHALKTVLMQRKGDRYLLCNYAVVPVEQSPETAADFAVALSNLVTAIGSKARQWTVALMHKEAVIRIVEQPDMPREILREAMRHNGELLVNQDLHAHVIDCAPLRQAENSTEAKRRYVVGAVPRALTTTIAEGFRKVNLSALQLEPITLFNAFEFAKTQVFEKESFMMLDLGFEASTIIIGSQGELVLVRAINYGSKLLLEGLAALAGIQRGEVLAALEKADPLLTQSARAALAELAREAASSIAFFEGHNEANISCIYVSGGVSHSKALVQLLAEELDRPCETWNAFEGCEIKLPAQKTGAFLYDACSLHAACGAAVQLLRGR